MLCRKAQHFFIFVPMPDHFDLAYPQEYEKSKGVPAFFQPVLAAVKSIFTLDLRALGLLRITMAMVVIIDQCIRMTDLEAFYSNTGVMPLHLLFEKAWNPSNFSIHAISGLWQVQALLFVLTIGFALAMLLGWRTKLFAFLTWIMVVSVQNRNPYILQGGDDLLRMILFWGMFLPWNRRYALDALDEELPVDNNYLGLPGVAYMVQIACLYYFSALLKDSAEWRTDGTALYYALSLDQLVFPLGKWLYQFPQLLKTLTFVVFYTELIAPFLLFVPVFSPVFRMISVFLIVSLHLGIGLTLFVGLFFLIGIASTTGLLTTSVMDAIERRLAGVMERIRNFFLQLKEKMNGWVSFHLSFRLKHLSNKHLEISKNIFVACCLLFVVLWNIQNLGVYRNLTRSASFAGQLIKLDQNWGMFAPTVFKDDGWFILKGTTESNKEIDLNRGAKPLDYEKPESVVSLFKNDRWRKYSENYLFISNSFLRAYYSNFIFDKWNAEHPDNKLKKLEVIYMKEITQPDYKIAEPTRELLSVTEPATNEPE